MTLLLEPFAPLFGLTRDPLFAAGGAVRSFVPPADVVVTEGDVTVVMDVPGFGTDEIDVELTGDVLTIRGERAFPYQRGTKDGRTWQRLERGFGKFERVLTVPKGLHPETIEASMADGVLTLRIPKPEARKPRRIHINGASSQPAVEAASTEAEPALAEDRELAGATA